MKKVLIVEDDKNIRENLEELLMMYKMEVDVVNDGIEALKYLEKKTPELIISDVLMAKMDGIELRKNILTNSELKDIQFVFLTAVNEKNKLQDRDDLGEFEFIPKPYKISDIKNVLSIK